MPPTNSSKAIARAAAASFGGRPRVDRYWDDNKASSVDLVSSEDSPTNGVSSFATVGVSAIPLLKDGADIGVRAELVGACDSQVTSFANCLATAAFFVINSRWLVAPGIVFPDILSIYDASWTMRHLLFLPPFLWDPPLETLVLDDETKVAWLLAVPIAQSEMLYAEQRGVPALEELFDQHQIDIFDLRREPVV